MKMNTQHEDQRSHIQWRREIREPIEAAAEMNHKLELPLD
jgi:hypothetical protein